MLVSIDPGIRGCGVAVFAGKPTVFLKSAWYVENPIRKGNDAGVWRSMRLQIEFEASYFGLSPLDELIVETPTTHWRGRLQDIIALAALAGTLSTLWNVPNVMNVAPREWK